MSTRGVISISSSVPQMTNIINFKCIYLLKASFVNVYIYISIQFTTKLMGMNWKPLREREATLHSSQMKPGIIFSEKKMSVCIFRQRQKGVQIRAGITHGWGMLKLVFVCGRHRLKQHQFTTDIKHWWQMVAYHWTGQVPSLEHWYECPFYL